ncbi:hypothetical protein Efla_006522 [Eimeria flavescens]
MVLLGVCNPLLDVVAEVPASVLDEYDLPHGGAPGATKFIGCIGTDKEGKQLRDLLEQQGVKPIYKLSETKPTGTCMVLVTNKERCLCTNLGASVDIDEAFVQEKWAEVTECAAIYCTGFLMSSSSAVLLKLARYCRQTGKLFACNLSAEFLMHQFRNEYKDMLRMANITCGNKEEATKYAEINGLDATGSTGDIASQILDCMLEGLDDGPSKIKMVVITQGSDPVIVASRTPSGAISIASYPVPEVPAEKIVDLNGAGDAFVGGLLYGVMHDMSADSAIELGNWCAGRVIQRSGFSFDLTGIVPAESPSAILMGLKACSQGSFVSIVAGRVELLKSSVAHRIGTCRLPRGLIEYSKPSSVCSTAAATLVIRSHGASMRKVIGMLVA